MGSRVKLEPFNRDVRLALSYVMSYGPYVDCLKEDSRPETQVWGPSDHGWYPSSWEQMKWSRDPEKRLPGEIQQPEGRLSWRKWKRPQGSSSQREAQERLGLRKREDRVREESSGQRREKFLKSCGRTKADSGPGQPVTHSGWMSDCVFGSRRRCCYYYLFFKFLLWKMSNQHKI